MLSCKAFFWSVMLLVMGACTPLLTSLPGGVQDQLKTVYVANIPNRMGQQLRIHLLKALNPMGLERKKYELNVVLSKTESVAGISQDATTNRMRLTMSGAYTLKDLRTGKILLDDTLKTQSSYAYVQNGFYANTMSEEEAVRETLVMLQELIVLELAHYFEKASHGACE